MARAPFFAVRAFWRGDANYPANESETGSGARETRVIGLGGRQAVGTSTPALGLQNYASG